MTGSRIFAISGALTFAAFLVLFLGATGIGFVELALIIEAFAFLIAVVGAIRMAADEIPKLSGTARMVRPTTPVTPGTAAA
ncbi:hypothetical protein [Brevibacterium litoralis]|uniref:hypothetical protein n=1 Tax=Brevibacterium litoralis TaxID=3138935 RepID=UPI0032EFC52D